MEIVGSVESMVEWREEWGEESGIVGGKKGWGGTVGLKRGGKMVLFGNFYTISPLDGTKEIIVKTPFKYPKRSKLSSEGHELLSSRVIQSEDDNDRGRMKPSDFEDGFYRDTIKLGPEYATRMDDEGKVT
nr:hypothetical protein [Tanacetum cinerariifolium]